MKKIQTLNDPISEKVRKYSVELSEFYPLLLTKYPLNLYDKEIHSYKEYFNLVFFSSALVGIFDRIKKEYDAHAVALYHKIALSTFLLDTLNKFDSQNFPERIRALYCRWFERVYKDLSVQPDSYYHYEKESFCKDLAVCCLKALPVGGAWVVEPSRVSTKFLLKKVWPYLEERAHVNFTKNKQKGKKRIRERVVTLLIRLRLNKTIIPILTLFLETLKVYRLHYVIHTVGRYLPRFTKEQMNQAYMNIADLMKIHPSICGIYRESWFLDPNLKCISPELSYLWEVPQQNGATLFCVGNYHKAVKKATFMSPFRKRLYEEGKYRPMNYAYVWPREELLRWANMVSWKI